MAEQQIQKPQRLRDLGEYFQIKNADFGFGASAEIFTAQPTEAALELFRAKGHTEEPKLVVIKKFNIDKLSKSLQEADIKNMFLNEIRVLSKTKDLEYAVKYYGAIETDDKNLYIVQELFDGNNIDNYFDDLDQLKIISNKLFKGIKQLHQHNIVHNDIKFNNVLYNISSGELKIIDYGLSCYLTKCDIYGVSAGTHPDIGELHTKGIKEISNETMKFNDWWQYMMIMLNLYDDLELQNVYIVYNKASYLTEIERFISKLHAESRLPEALKKVFLETLQAYVDTNRVHNVGDKMEDSFFKGPEPTAIAEALGIYTDRIDTIDKFDDYLASAKRMHPPRTHQQAMKRQQQQRKIRSNLADVHGIDTLKDQTIDPQQIKRILEDVSS